ncbi:hypothetical protein ACHAXT_012759 [Thalassiosira profunda]
MGAVDSDVAFRACLGVLLSLLACGQLWVAGALFKHRHNSLLELSQPVALSLFAASGAVATLSSLTLAWSGGDGVCAVRQPIILLSISFMGSILVARSWRIGCIASPALAFSSAKAVEPSGGEDDARPSRSITRQTTLARIQKRVALHEGRLKALRMLSAMWGWTRFVRGCGRQSAPLRRSIGIKQQIQFEDSMWVAVTLMVPQIILQVVNLSVPALRMQSAEIDLGEYACQSELGPLMLTLGTLVSATPFLLALLLNVPSEGLPDIFCEFHQMAASLRVSIGVLVITLPVVLMVENELPSARAYLLTASVLGFVIPLCYHVAFASMSACNGRRGKSQIKKRPSHVERSNSQLPITRRKSSMGRSSFSQSSETDGEDNLELLQMAENAATMGTMYETLGNLPKAIQIDHEVLSLFKDDSEYSNEGFTDSEVRSFGPKTLQVVIAALVSTAKRSMNHRGTCNEDEEKERYREMGIKSAYGAMDVFERAPAKHLIQDRSVLFPAYSLMSVLIKGGISMTPNDQSAADFENGFASHFVRDTSFQLVHHCRSLSMKAEALATHGRFDEALCVISDIKSIYDPALHSKPIASNYGTDHCARVLALSAVWLQHLNRAQEAREHIDYAIENILPGVAETKELMSLSYVFAITVQVLRAQGRVALCSELWEKHGFAPPANQPSLATHFLEAVLVLLRCCNVQSDTHNNLESNNSIESDVAWALDEEEKIVQWGARIWSEMICWSFHSLWAEICLLLANNPTTSAGRSRALIERGLRLSSLAEAELKDDKGNITSQISYASHLRIRSELVSTHSQNTHAANKREKPKRRGNAAASINGSSGGGGSLEEKR